MHKYYEYNIHILYTFYFFFSRLKKRYILRRKTGKIYYYWKDLTKTSCILNIFKKSTPVLSRKYNADLSNCWKTNRDVCMYIKINICAYLKKKVTITLIISLHVVRLPYYYNCLSYWKRSIRVVPSIQQ